MSTALEKAIACNELQLIPRFLPLTVEAANVIQAKKDPIKGPRNVIRGFARTQALEIMSAAVTTNTDLGEVIASTVNQTGDPKIQNGIKRAFAEALVIVNFAAQKSPQASSR